MRRFLTASCIVFALLASNVFGQPDGPSVASTRRLVEGARVGLLVSGLDGPAVHEHVGTTVFNNFVQERTLPWNLSERARDAFAESLSSAGYEVVPIEDPAVDARSVASLLTREDARWNISKESRDLYLHLRRDLRLDAIISVAGQPVVAQRDCVAGCINRMISKSGLFSRSFMNLDLYFAVPAFEFSAMQLDPPALITSYEAVATVMQSRSKVLRGDERPKDVAKVSDAEFAVVVDWINTYVNSLARATAAALAGQDAK